jgi:hypothetical protein
MIVTPQATDNSVKETALPVTEHHHHNHTDNKHDTAEKEKKSDFKKTLKNYALGAGGLGAMLYFGNKNHLEHAVQHALLGGITASIMLNPVLSLLGNNPDASHGHGNGHSHGHNHGTTQGDKNSNAIVNFATEVAHHLMIGKIIDSFFGKHQHH